MGENNPDEYYLDLGKELAQKLAGQKKDRKIDDILESLGRLKKEFSAGVIEGIVNQLKNG
jgi:Glu-tRNA(Gln) amidotransferase subunit E-like FAD-binding protein